LDANTLATLKRQLREHLLNPASFSNDHLLIDPITPESLRSLLASQRADGTWPDLDYTSQIRSRWPARDHVERARDLAKAWALPGGLLQGDAAVRTAVLRALDHWLAKDYENPNWWHNEIGIPRAISELILLMESELGPKQKSDALRIIARAKISRTGQNLLWLAGITLTRGLLENDAALVGTARAAIVGEITVGRGEGMQADHSFHQHGPQLQFGNYGLAYAIDLVKWSKVLRGTPLALDREAATLLGDYLLHGMGATVWNGTMDVNACARQLFPDAPRRKASALGVLLEDQALADPARAPAFAEAAARCRPGGAGGPAANSLFWHSEYMTHREHDYLASVRMSSRRVIGAEAGNGENLRGYHLGDGALYVYRHGGEYRDIFPFWDWRQIPGITARQAGGPLPVLDWDGYRLDTDFAGGVSDGRLGATALDFKRDGVAARKAWFFLEGRIVCLGAGIESDSDDVVLTSVAQQFRSGPIWLGPDAGTAGPGENGGRRELATPAWLWHDGTGVVFPDAGRVGVDSARRTGRWNDVATFGSTEPETGEVFSAWIDHGTAPNEASYAYILLPGADKEATAAFLRAPNVRILANTPAVQAAGSADVLMAVFYRPGRVETDVAGELAVDQPCVLLARKNPVGGWNVTVADPARRASRIRATLGASSWLAALPQDKANTGRSVVAIPERRSAGE
jgi:chondroitin AC lyase